MHLFRSPSAEEADQRLFSLKQIVSSGHLVTFCLCGTLALKKVKTRLFVGSVSLLHGIAWLCMSGLHPPTQSLTSRRLRIIASLCALASWVARTGAHYRYSIGMPPMGAITLRAYSHGLGIPSELLVSTLEQVHAYLLLPGYLVAIWLPVHFAVTYGAIAYGNAQPGLLGTLIWALLQFGLPQLLHHYMHKAVQQPQRIAALAASVSRVTAVAASKTSLEKSDKAGSDEGCSKPQGDSKPVPSLQDEDEICKQEVQLKVQGSSVDDARSTEAAAGPLNAEGSMGQPRPADSAKPSQHAVLEQAASASSRPADLPLARVPSTRVPPSMLQAIMADGAAPNPEALQALQNARALVRRARQGTGYQSRLVQPQVVIKLTETEPHQLRPGVVAASNEVLAATGPQRLLVAHACVRKGCSLLTFSLMGVVQPIRAHAMIADDVASAVGHSALTPQSIQAWLKSLLAPDTTVPDGAVAHISVGSQRLTATWRQEDRGWALPVAAAAGALEPGVRVQLLHAEGCVARLPLLDSSHNRSSGAASSHRTSLLLQLTGSTDVVFEGLSDSTSAAPEPQTPCGSRVVTCVARGAWGTCLPVTATALVEAGQAALMLDVDLASAPHAGAVQLELWQGHTLLVSAPLLLLPPLGVPEAGAGDRLVDELTGSLGSWEEDEGEAPATDGQPLASHQHAPSGNAAWLNDLGHVIHVSECIKAAAAAGGLGSSGGAQNWGGVVTSIAHNSAHDPDLLSHTLLLAEGLLDHADSNNLASTAALVASVSDQVRHQLELQRQQQQEPEPRLPTPTQPEPSLPKRPSSVDSDGFPVAIKPHQRSPSPFEKEVLGSDSSKGMGGSGSASLRHRRPLAYDETLLPERPCPSPHLSSKSVSPAGSSDNRSLSGTPAAPPALRDAAVAVLRGFDSQQEQHYKLWVAQRNAPLILTWGLLFLGILGVGLIRSAVDNLPEFWSELPAHTLNALPYLTTVVLTYLGHYRWQENIFLLHATVRTTVLWLASLGYIRWPEAYKMLFKIRLDLWAEPIMHTPSEPQRLPYLLASNFILLWYAPAAARICGDTASSWIGRGLVSRGASLTVGLALDCARRLAFMREMHNKSA